ESVGRQRSLVPRRAGRGGDALRASDPARHLGNPRGEVRLPGHARRLPAATAPGERALMKATVAVTPAKGAPFELREVELGELRPDEVLVEVAASGICHTDLICRDQWIPVPLPAVLGHEGAGVVASVGSAVTKVAAGDRVGMTFDSCGGCPSCLV